MNMPYYGSTLPLKQDSRLALLFKILGAINNANGGPVNIPGFFPEGSTPLMQDTEWKLLAKICGAMNYLAENSSGASGGSTWGLNGDNLVRRNDDVYIKDAAVGDYHFLYSSSSEAPWPALGVDATGYSFTNIPT